MGSQIIGTKKLNSREGERQDNNIDLHNKIRQRTVSCLLFVFYLSQLVLLLLHRRTFSECFKENFIRDILVKFVWIADIIVHLLKHFNKKKNELKIEKLC